MADFSHLVYLLCLVLFVLAALSLADVFNTAALLVLGFAAVSGLAWCWFERTQARQAKRRH